MYEQKQRYEIKCAVFLLLTKKENGKEYILLQRRYNTGLLDGMYDVSCSGHLEEKETLAEAMIRETKEELGIEIQKENLKYSSTIHAKFKDKIEYLLVTFQTSQYQGIPCIMEVDKCDDLIWTPIDELPINIIDTRKTMIDNYLHYNLYNEYGFDNKK